MNPASLGARTAALRLSPEYGPNLVVEVEIALSGRRRRGAPYFDLVAIAGMIVSIATLAWTVYTDSSRAGRRPSTEDVKRAVLKELADERAAAAPAPERIVVVVVESVVEHAAELPTAENDPSSGQEG